MNELINNNFIASRRTVIYHVRDCIKSQRLRKMFPLLLFKNESIFRYFRQFISFPLFSSLSLIDSTEKSSYGSWNVNVLIRLYDYILLW